MPDLEQALKERIVIFDGAMGTEIYRKNFFVNVSYENLCLASPAIIRGIHQAYRDAGANVLTTNSYGANENKLRKFGLAEKMREINIASVNLAREVAKEDLFVAASVGPLGELPAGLVCDEKECVRILKEQISALAEAKPDFIIFESISSKEDFRRALEAANDFTLPFILSLSLDASAATAQGTPAEELLEILEKTSFRKPAALGLNCGNGPASALHAMEELAHKVTLPVIVQPNAGTPKNVDDRMIYMASPEYFTTYALRCVSLGARGVGGCCGTTPEHIADLARSVNPLAKIEKASKTTVCTVSVPLQDPVPTEKKSSLAEKLCRGEWVYTVEMVPPQGYLLAKTVEKAGICAEAGFDAVNIPDGPRASSRVSPIITAIKIMEGAHIETVLHFCCRDRNLIGMQADLLGCAAMNIHNILFITGDPPKLGDYPFASGVFDMDSIGSVKLQSRLNRGVDIAGKPIDAPTGAFIEVGADPNAIDMAREIRRTREKIAAGAEAVVTQPVFDPDSLLRFIEKIPELAEKKIPLIAGIWPLASYRNAEFMKNEVPGVVVPDEVLERMAKPETKEEQREVGIQIARDAIAKIRSSVSGAQISAPFGNVQTAIAVMKK